MIHQSKNASFPPRLSARFIVLYGITMYVTINEARVSTQQRGEASLYLLVNGVYACVCMYVCVRVFVPVVERWGSGQYIWCYIYNGQTTTMYLVYDFASREDDRNPEIRELIYRSPTVPPIPLPTM